MKNFLVLHGHFYQPPRENPWTGVLPMQKSAEPYHDWNIRITKECYGANAFSRILDSEGRILDIVNNYEYISFNFGPTLLSWLETNAPNIYMRIIDADRISSERNEGHGNAIAQGYNHTILPLDSPKDAEIQIKWGMKDFERHFGRVSEGLWLPETAVNDGILDIVIDQGIKFLILSPWQAEKIQTGKSNEWVNLSDQPAPSGRPYKIDRPGGSVTVFFYDNILAQGISFGHYLRSADALYNKLIGLWSAKDSSHLINTATDGEIYGHHEPFGDMCLASLSQKILKDNKLVLTNYAHYLDQFPPVYEVKLKGGQENKGTSWSCHHGVSRWYKNCGCSTGGGKDWNQEWRTPLREAFNLLSNKMILVYTNEMKEFSDIDPLIVFENYIDVIIGYESRETFAQKFLSSSQAVKGNTSRFFQLLEGQKFRLFMFTSCAWFFSDISGIESVQNIRYALRGMQINNLEKSVMPKFLSLLDKAKSNIKEAGSGRDILISVKPEHSPTLEVSLSFMIRSLLENKDNNPMYGLFELTNLESIMTGKRNESDIQVSITNTHTGEDSHYSFLISDTEASYASISFRKGDETEYRELTEIIGMMPDDIREEYAELFLSTMETSYFLYDSTNLEKLIEAFEYSKKLKITVPEIMIKTAEIVVFSKVISLLSVDAQLIPPGVLEEIRKLFRFTKDFDINFNKAEIIRQISKHLAALLNKPQDQIDDASIDYIYNLFEITREGGFEPEITIAQVIIFRYIKIWRENLKDPNFHVKKENGKDLERIISLGKVLHFVLDDLESIQIN